MSNINKRNSFDHSGGPFHSDPEARLSKGKGKKRETTPASRAPSPPPNAVLDLRDVASALSTTEGARPAIYNYYNPLHQAGPPGVQIGISAQGSQRGTGQPDEAKPSSASRASGFSARARKASLVTVDERIAKMDVQQPKQLKEQLKAMEKRIPDRLARRVQSAPSPDQMKVSLDKTDGYFLNKKHGVGGKKAPAFEKAGFKLLHEYEKGNPESWRAAARADPEFQEKRNALINQLGEDVKVTHATRQDDRSGETFYTKHTVISNRKCNTVYKVRSVRRCKIA